MRLVLFESPLILGIALGFINFVLLVLWRRGGSPRPLVLGLFVAAGLLLAQALIVTNRERAGMVMRPIERDLVASRMDALPLALAFDFAAGEMEQGEFLALVREQLRRVRITWIRRTALEVVRAGTESFVAEVAYLAEIDARDYRGPVRSRWRLAFRRDEEGWRIVTIEPISLDGIPADWSDISR